MQLPFVGHSAFALESTEAAIGVTLSPADAIGEGNDPSASSGAESKNPSAAGATSATSAASAPNSGKCRRERCRLATNRRCALPCCGVGCPCRRPKRNCSCSDMRRASRSRLLWQEPNPDAHWKKTARRHAFLGNPEYEHYKKYYRVRAARTSPAVPSLSCKTRPTRKPSFAQEQSCRRARKRPVLESAGVSRTGQPAFC